MSEDECIAILNIALKRSKEYFEKIGAHILLGNTEQQAIETILDLYMQEKEKNKNLIKQLQEQNTEIQDISKQLREKEQEDIKMRAKFILSLDDYISKDKIREKIKELEGQEDWYRENKSLDDLYGRTDELIELLEEE